MADKKLTTEEILAKLRQQDAGGDSTSSAAQEAPAEEAPPAAVSAKPAAKPSSTADILAAARTQKVGESGGAAEPTAAKKPSGAAKPSSTADILAAARAGKGGAATGTAKPPAAGVKPAAAKKATAPPADERPSVADMVKAAREGRPMEDQAAKPAKPKLPAKPPLPRAKKPADDPNRRGFLVAAITTLCTPYYFAWSVLAAIGGIWTLATARFMMPNMIVEPPTKFKIGPPSDYPPGTVATKLKAERGIWVVNTEYDGRNLIYALSTVCTHLGCTPNWLEGEQKFKCPCHGSGFYITGINFEGPAPRPLERVGLKLADDGSLEVDKSVKFQEELGQWQDAASFVEMS